MKVLHILNHSLPQLDGYAIRSANILRYQAQMGLETVAITSPAQKSRSNTLVENIDDLRYYRTMARGVVRLPILGRLQLVRRLSQHIDQVVRLESPDILHAHSPCLWGAAAARVARRRKLPLVYEIRGFWEDAAVDQGFTRSGSLRYRMTRLLETHVCRQANAVVTIGDGLKQELRDRGIPSEKITTVPNGVDTVKFTPRERNGHLERTFDLNGAIRIGYLGTLYPWEGVEHLVCAVPHILASVSNVRVLIVGGGSQEAPVRNLIERLGLSNCVSFVGSVPHDDVIPFYSILDVLVYPRKSTRNTELVTPLKPLEAMAMDRAVIGSNVGGIRELFAANTGLLCRASDPADLAQKCIQLIRDPEQRRLLAQNARRYVAEQRDWRLVVESYGRVYSELNKSNAQLTNCDAH